MLAAQKGKVPWLPIAIAVALLFTLPSGFSLIFGHGNLGNAEAAVPILLLGGVAYLMWRATHGELPRRRGPHGPNGPPSYSAQGWTAPPPPESSITTPSAPAPTSTPWPETDPATSTDPPLWARNAAPPTAPPEPVGGAGAAADPDEDPLLAEARRLSDPFLNEPLLFETAPSSPTAPGVPASPPNRRGAGRAALAALLIGAGTVGLAVALGVPFAPFAVLAGALVAIGVGLVFGGLTGRSSRGLIIPGLIVFGALSVATVVDLPSASAGERSYQPTTVARSRTPTSSASGS